MTSVSSDPTAMSATGRSPRRRWVRTFWTVVAALALILVLHAFVGQIFMIPSGSMENTLNPGNRVAVSKLGYGPTKIKHGDIVVFDGTGSFIAYSNPSPLAQVADWFGVLHSKRYFVKRVIGLPGDHLRCCTKAGLLVLNGKAINESAYIGIGTPASDITFNVVVPAGHLWLMGDNRPVSADSRSHMGDPGGGFVPESKVVGRVIAVIWPPSAIRTIKPGAPQ